MLATEAEAYESCRNPAQERHSAKYLEYERRSHSTLPPPPPPQHPPDDAVLDQQLSALGDLRRQLPAFLNRGERRDGNGAGIPQRWDQDVCRRNRVLDRQVDADAGDG